MIRTSRNSRIEIVPESMAFLTMHAQSGDRSHGRTDGGQRWGYVAQEEILRRGRKQEIEMRRCFIPFGHGKSMRNIYKLALAMQE